MRLLFFFVVFSCLHHLMTDFYGEKCCDDMSTLPLRRCISDCRFSRSKIESYDVIDGDESTHATKRRGICPALGSSWTECVMSSKDGAVKSRVLQRPTRKPKQYAPVFMHFLLTSGKFTMKERDQGCYVFFLSPRPAFIHRRKEQDGTRGRIKVQMGSGVPLLWPFKGTIQWATQTPGRRLVTLKSHTTKVLRRHRLTKRRL